MKFNDAYAQVVMGVFEPAMLLNVWPDLDKMLVVKKEMADGSPGVTASDLLLSYIIFTTQAFHKLGLIDFESVLEIYQEMIKWRKEQHIQQAHNGNRSGCTDMDRLDTLIQAFPMRILSTDCFKDQPELEAYMDEAIKEGLDSIEPKIYSVD